LFSSLELAYTQRRWSRLNGRSSSLLVTMYCRSSGPNLSRKKRACPTTGKLRTIACFVWTRSCTVVAAAAAAVPPRMAYLHFMIRS
jgi:hypothetical protein